MDTRTCRHLKDAIDHRPIPKTLPKVLKPALMLYGNDASRVTCRWLCSEKLDGIRAYFDGTHLISRNGTIFDAPERLLRPLRNQRCRVDGELWCPGRTLGELNLATQSTANHKRWTGIQFYVFDVHTKDPFVDRYAMVCRFPYHCRHTELGRQSIEARLAKVTDKGGEGLVLRDPAGRYVPKRSPSVVKVKPSYEGEAVSLGDGWYQEEDEEYTPRFRMRGEAVPEGESVAFLYRGRTSHGKPLYPVQT